MSLIDALDGAQLVVVDQDRRLAYVWFGGSGVNVFDGVGDEVHYFTIGGTASKLTPALVRAAIDRVRASDHT
jgi:hypothetical protein